MAASNCYHKSNIERFNIDAIDWMVVGTQTHPNGLSYDILEKHNSNKTIIAFSLNISWMRNRCDNKSNLTFEAPPPLRQSYFMWHFPVNGQTTAMSPVLYQHAGAALNLLLSRSQQRCHPGKQFFMRIAIAQ